MNIETLLEHYGIMTNPFRAEEARQDAIFDRVEGNCHHPDFEKIRGDFGRPATSIVFGERGAGKTAIKLQIEQSVLAHNLDQPDRRCLVVTYDELNPVLDRFRRSMPKASPQETLEQFLLIDHLDAMLNAVVPRIIDQALGDHLALDGPVDFNGDPARQIRRLDAASRHELMMLQVCYDRPDGAHERTRSLKRALRHRSINRTSLFKWSALAMAVISMGVLLWFLLSAPEANRWLWMAAIGLLLAATAGLGARFGWLWARTQRLAHELAKNLRVLDRPAASFARSLGTIDIDEAAVANLPRSDSDDARYGMFNRLLRVVHPYGYRSIVILVDRVDEPSLVHGEPDRMRALVWPLLNNKFLQQDHVAVKLLLPLELRHLLNRETSAFYREARLDKQNLVERLTWSGATLYDLCTARLNACRPAGESPLSLTDLFEDSVTHQDIIDALEQMQQPRDAFKFLYRLLQEHCSNVPQEAPSWKIARPLLDTVRKAQAERMSGMLRGVNPA